LAATADVAALDNPNLANRRVDVRCELISSQVEDPVETRASSDLLKNPGYSVFLF
jgi:hypothetical protein